MGGGVYVTGELLFELETFVFLLYSRVVNSNIIDLSQFEVKYNQICTLFKKSIIYHNVLTNKM